MISVVVPVYNVEKYLEKCLKSLITQTYRDFEIILVDDGSTDESGLICDYYGNEYSYIRTYHKKNGGLSDARNYALQYIRGDHVTFVDSDDYVEPIFLDKLCFAAETFEADIVVAGHFDETEEGKVLAVKGGLSEEIDLISGVQALEKMCYETEFGTSACGKLFPVELVRKYPFPVGRLYEDLATIYKMFGEAGRTAVLNRPLYHYIQRRGSIRYSGWKPEVMDIMTAAEQLLEYVTLNYPDIKAAAVQRYFFSANEVYIRAFREKDYFDIVEPVQNKLKNYWKFIKSNRQIRVRQKLRYSMMVSFPGLYRFIWNTLKNRS